MPETPGLRRAVRILVAGLVVAACTPAPASPGELASPGGGAASPTAIASPGPATAAPREDYAGAEAVIPVAAGPRGVAVADGSVWVAAALGGVVQRVDPGPNQVVAEIPLELPVTLVTVDGHLWASVLHEAPSEADDQIVRIDTAANEVLDRIDVPVFHNFAAGGGLIWAVDVAGGLRSVDPGTGRVRSLGSVGGMTIGLAANDDAVWGIRGDGVAWRHTIAGGELIESELGVGVPGRSRVAVGPDPGGSVWVGVPGTVLAIDPETLEVLAELSLPGMTLVNDLWVDEDVWLSANVTDAGLGLDGGSVLRLDTAATIRSAYPLGPESSGVVAVDGTVWAVDQRDHVLARFAIGPP